MTMRLSSTIMEIWPFKVLPGRLFQEQRSVIGRSSVGRSVLSITLISCSLCWKRSVREVKILDGKALDDNGEQIRHKNSYYAKQPMQCIYIKAV